jgi:hypothetical protein
LPFEVGEGATACAFANKFKAFRPNSLIIETGNFATEQGIARSLTRKHIGRLANAIAAPIAHGRTLTFAQLRQQDDLPVGELQGIMMDFGLVLVDLPDARRRGGANGLGVGAP